MATKKAEEKAVFSIKGMSLANIRKLSDNVIAFSLLGNGLGLYNLRIVEGKKGKFIATPQQQGKDKKWYNIYAVYFSAEDQEKIIKAVEAKMPEEEEEPEIDF